MIKLTSNDIRAALGAALVRSRGETRELLAGVANDSRQAGLDKIFVAVRGGKFDGHQFVPAAVAAGAAAVAHTEELPEYRDGVAYLQVSDGYLAHALLCEAFAGRPADKLSLFGVTGTNGKTSTAYIMAAILRTWAGKCGMVTTVLVDNGGAATIPAAATTPPPDQLQEIFCRMVENGCRHAAMEVSSHALTQSRIGSAQFAAAVFTNLTGDHLDYHGDMNSYFQAKESLFSRHLAADGVAVVNADDPYGRRLLASPTVKATKISYGMAAGGGMAADCAIKLLASSIMGTQAQLRFRDGEVVNVDSNLFGTHNLYNLAGAAAACHYAGVPVEAIETALRAGINIPGRLERVDLPSGAAAFIDYAHTDDALRNVLSTLRPATDGRLILVFGAGGDRDRSKRPRMGAAAAEFADILVITNDNPRSEPPLEIIEEIRAAVPASATQHVIPDRGEAITAAVGMATAGDVILVAGKGHETYQEINGVRLPFDDLAALSAWRPKKPTRPTAAPPIKPGRRVD